MTFRWRTFALALGSVGAMLIIAWVSWCPPYYLENDDVSIRMALEGFTVPGAPPTGFALWPNALLGWGVVFLQRAWPSIAWWDVVLAGSLVWALAVFVALAWDALGHGWLTRVAAVSAVALAIAPLFASFQFTISSTLAGGAAALVAIAELGAARPRRGVLVFALLLLIAGVLIRPMGAPAGAAVAAVLSLPSAVRSRRLLVAVGGVVVVAGGAYMSAQRIDAALYGREAEWGRYLQYNLMGGPLVDWGSDVASDHQREIQQATGWSTNDWLMLYRAMGVDPDVHGFERVSRAYEAQSAIIRRIGIASLMLERVRGYSAEGLRNLLSGSAVVVVAAMMLAVGWGTRRAVIGSVAIVLLFWGICFALDVAFERLPWRLLAPLQVIFVGAILSTVGASLRVLSPVEERVPRPAIAILATSVMFAMTLPIVAAQAREARSRASRPQAIDSELRELQRTASPSLIVFYGSRFPREYWWRPFHRPSAQVAAVTLGWNNQSPQLQHFLTATGRQPLFRAVCRDSSMALVADKDALDMLSTYMREHFDTSVEWTQVYDGSFPAWRCSVASGRS